MTKAVNSVTYRLCRTCHGKSDE